MTNETFRILLEAKNPEKGICGLTGADAGKDLFGQWLIDVSCGWTAVAGDSSPTPLRMIRASCPP